MKVVLTKKVDNLGGEGDIKEVADGYGRNFLIPKGFAVEATKQNVASADANKSRKEKDAKMELQEVQSLAEQLEGRELYMKVKEKDGILFGSVNEKNIAKELKNEGLKVEAANVKIDEPIKEMGDYDIRIELDHGLEANLRLILVAEEN
ncbi:MAG: 50S ribosomal protein L9 [Parcubacteria group bacterium]|jgi:large subunit ribosomal protein L9